MALKPRAPAHLDGYAALPLTRGMIDQGMALAVAGSLASGWLYEFVS